MMKISYFSKNKNYLKEISIAILVRKTAKLSLKLRLVIKDIFGIPRIDFGVNSWLIVLGILLFTKSI